MSVLKKSVFALTVIVFAISWISPTWPLEQALHSSLTVVGLIWLVLHERRWTMHGSDFIAVCVFIALHCVAARWLYSNVPYDAWLRAAFGWSPQLAFGWERNHFDRLIHLMYGLCFTGVLCTHARQRWPGVTAQQAFMLAVMVIMVTSLIYEWLEWAIALLLSPDAAEAYNGQQGDPWDAHADMLLATVGALLIWPWRRRHLPTVLAVQSTPHV